MNSVNPCLVSFMPTVTSRHNPNCLSLLNCTTSVNLRYYLGFDYLFTCNDFDQLVLGIGELFGQLNKHLSSRHSTLKHLVAHSYPFFNCIFHSNYLGQRSSHEYFPSPWKINTSAIHSPFWLSYVNSNIILGIESPLLLWSYNRHTNRFTKLKHELVCNT